ncbi:MAG: L,D-transpeptidase family protein [Kiritimatiellae bacterium]|jgi:hypothetical protein|nr:L,D-transpeptidase family protein [Kiritimatiellia bacterium]
MKSKFVHMLLAVILFVLCALPFRGVLRRQVVTMIQVFRGKKTVADRVDQFGGRVRKRLVPAFERIDVAYPPETMTLLGIKQDRVLELWVSNPPKLLKTYPILGASGGPGPKLLEGDRQVPEGLYRIESLNPNSLYHLSLRLNYPNAFDLAKGKFDGRKELGSDIMIHGKQASIGCLAMGDEAAEELFVLAAETGIENVSVILAPVDFRSEKLPEQMSEVPAWTSELYALIQSEILRFEN